MELFRKIMAVGKAFRLCGRLQSCIPIGSGKINETYRAVYMNDDGSEKSYIVQSVNRSVFADPVEVMCNIDKVTEYIRSRFPNEQTLHFHHTNTGENYFIDSDGDFWRVMNWVRSRTFTCCDNTEMIAAAGKAFGHFQNQLSDFDGAQLAETIPDFHNTAKRLDMLFAHIADDSCVKSASAQPEIRYIASVREKAGELSVRCANGEFPIRVTHNDTKCSNVLFDCTTNMPILVIDLDTVMPGMVMYDFGDGVRSFAHSAAAGEAGIYLDTEKFTAFCKGYLEEAADILTQTELENLVTAVFSVTLELAARYLDDYLTGDRYFKTEHPEHNLMRCRKWLALAKDIQRKENELKRIVEETVREIRAE